MTPSSRPRVAIASQIPLAPITAGNRARVLALVKALQSLGYEVIFVQIPSLDGDETGDIANHEKIVGAGNYYVVQDTSFIWKCARYVYHKVQRGLRKAVRLAAPKSDFGYQEPVDFRISRETCRAVARIAEDRHVETCIVEYVMHSRILDYLPKTTRKILDTHDLFSNRHRKYLKDGRPYGFWISLTRGQETMGLMRADTVLAIQKSEESRFREMLGHEKGKVPVVKTIGHFMEIASAPLISNVDNRMALICSDNTANMEGYFLFLDKVLPIVLKTSPAFRLLVAGSICSAIPDHAAIDKFGMFEKIEDVFASAPSALNPVVSGSGVAIKVLDALACGVSVASTATGARGLSELGESGILISPDYDHVGLARHIVSLTANASLRNSEGVHAYETAQRWNEQQRAELLDVLSA